MSLFYGITLAVSLLLLGVYLRVDQKREPYLLLMFVFVCICNGGYLGLSLSGTLKTALMFNSIAYLGNVFLPFFVLMMMLRLINIKSPKWVNWLLIILNCCVFLLASSGGWLKVYYREVSLVIVDGAAQLSKVYGPLHFLYKLFLLGYFSAMIAVTFMAAKRQNTVSTRQTMFLALVVLGNIALWLVENLTGVDFEFVTISYLMSECLILMLYGIMQDQEGMLQSASNAGKASEPDSSVDGTTFSRDDLQRMYAELPGIDLLSVRELEVLHHILQRRRRKDIAETLFITESTVKKHTGNIFKKLNVSGREELFRLAEERLHR